MRAKRDALVGLMVVAAAWAGSASAAPTKAQVCEAAKTTAAGKLEKCLADERAKEVKGQSFNYAKCDTAFMKAFTAAVLMSAGASQRG